MINTKENIVEVFGYNEFCIYENMDNLLKEKYRLYITRRINCNIFDNKSTMSPSYWLEQYNEKKTFEYIAKKLDLEVNEVIEIYNNALKKMKKLFDDKKLSSNDF